MTPAIFDTPIDFERLEGFTPVIRPLAEGMRASVACECPSCAVIGYLNPNDERVKGFVRTGVATLGHLLHQAWAFQAFRGVAYRVEAAIPWEHGVSHDDVLVNEGPWAGVYECKTHSETAPKAPSGANIRQAQFRLRLRERAGLVMPGPMRMVMIGKAGNEGAMVRGPWTVELTDERRAEIDHTLDVIDRLMARAGSIDLDVDAELREHGCSRCFPKPKVETAASTDSLLGRWARLKCEHDRADAERKAAAQRKAVIADAMQSVRDTLDERIPYDGATHTGIVADATRNKAGALTLRVRRDAPADLLALRAGDLPVAEGAAA